MDLRYDDATAVVLKLEGVGGKFLHRVDSIGHWEQATNETDRARRRKLERQQVTIQELAVENKRIKVDLEKARKQPQLPRSRSSSTSSSARQSANATASRRALTPANAHRRRHLSWRR